MPTYQYRCADCAHEFEEFQSITDDPISICPKCQGKPHRLITGGAGFLFKGSGFYQTDYRSSDYKSRAKADKPDSSSAADSSSSGKKTSEKKSSEKKGTVKE